MQMCFGSRHTCPGRNKQTKYYMGHVMVTKGNIHKTKKRENNIDRMDNMGRSCFLICSK